MLCYGIHPLVLILPTREKSIPSTDASDTLKPYGEYVHPRSQPKDASVRIVFNPFERNKRLVGAGGIAHARLTGYRKPFKDCFIFVLVKSNSTIKTDIPFRNVLLSHVICSMATQLCMIVSSNPKRTNARPRRSSLMISPLTPSMTPSANFTLSPSL